MPENVLHYGVSFKPGTHPARVEIELIKMGGEGGLGVFKHYKSLFSILWPEDDHHRWSDLILKHLLEDRITVVSGSRGTAARPAPLASGRFATTTASRRPHSR